MSKKPLYGVQPNKSRYLLIELMIFLRLRGYKSFFQCWKIKNWVGLHVYWTVRIEWEWKDDSSRTGSWERGRGMSLHWARTTRVVRNSWNKVVDRLCALCLLIDNWQLGWSHKFVGLQYIWVRVREYYMFSLILHRLGVIIVKSVFHNKDWLHRVRTSLTQIS